MSKFKKPIISLLRKFLPLFFCLFSALVFSQGYTYVLDEYEFEDGLVYKQVNTVFEDRDGLIWIGTSKGLLRYDGEEFKVWNSDDETGLIYAIKLITQDDEGILWLWNTEVQQFIFLNPYTGKIQSTASKFGDKFPNKLDANTSTPGFSLPGKSLIRSPEGHLYFGTNLLDHFYSYHSTTGFQEIKAPQGYSYVLSCINDTLYVADYNFEVCMYSINGKSYGKKKFSEQEELFLKNEFKNPIFKNINLKSIINKNYEAPEYFTAINQGKTAKLDTINQCFYLLTPERWLAITNSNDTLLNLNVDAFKNPNLFRHENLILDSRNNVWAFGHFGLVRLKIERNKFHQILSKQKGKNIACRGISSNDSYIYVTGENTNTTYKVAKDQNTEEEEMQYDEFPRALLTLSNDELLIGCADIFNADADLNPTTKFGFYPKENYWWGNNYGVWSMYQDSYGTVWAGKGNYLAQKRIDDSLFRSHKPSEKILSKSGNEATILSFVKEGKDSLWLCSEGGLYLLDIAKDKIVKHYHELEDDYLPASKFYHLHKDKAGKYWIGTNKGLIEWEGPAKEEQYKHYTIKDNLSNEVIYGVYEDHKNRLWMSSDYGIMSFEKEDKIVHTYLEKNGISHYEFNRTSHHQDSEGKIYFGGLNGVTYLDPHDFDSNSRVDLGLVISEFNVFDGASEQLLDKTGELIETKTITFKPTDKYFKLKFSLPTFDGKNNKLYAWKIEGIHSDWNHQSSNSIEIGMLPYGDFELIIKGRTKEGSWTKNPLNINLNVVRPFYKTLWFIILSVLALISMVVLFFKLRTRLLKKKIKEATSQIVSDKRIIEQQSEDLKKLDKLKTQFFTNVSHELRTPLTLMMGPINRLKNTANDNAGDQGPMLDILHRNTVQLRNLVDEILDLSKLENNKMTLDESPVNLSSYLNNHLKQYYSYYSSESLHFEANILIDKALTLLIDLKKFDKILNNFLANAIKFTERDGYVTLYAERINDDVQIAVKDTGRGIHPDDLPKIFDRFYQSKHGNLATEGGTGIGLSLCRELAGLMNGKVWVESVLESGSTFYFSFPVKEFIEQGIADDYSSNPIDSEADYLEKRKEVEVANRIDKTILIVEDNEDLREYQKIILNSYNVVVAENGKEALDYIAKNAEPDIIISDLMMPVMDGMELIEKVKSSNALRHIPFIMLTAKTNQQIKIKALRYGIDDYLTKPFDEEELRVRISNLLKFQESRLASIDLDTNEDVDSASVSDYHLSQNDLEWLQTLETFIIDNLRNEFLNVTLLSKEMAMSDSTLLRQLKKLTGMTPGKYIQELRLNKAKEYLLNKSYKTISLVSNNVGFKDSNSFARTFKKRFGKRPSDIGV